MAEQNNAAQTKAARRSFFTGLGLVATAAAVAKLTPSTSSVSAQSGSTSAPQEPQGEGYRLSEHIKKYYRTTTI